MSEKVLHSVITENAGEETQRQFSFMEKAEGYVKELEKELGRKPTACVVTFGCQVNTVHGI